MDATTALQRLPEAEAALHSLLIGQVEVEITGPDGRRVQYNQVNVQQLRNYIEELKAAAGTVRRPILFTFGR
ncbi:MAG TPA: gpW family head-tail joining protein [Candidatus Limnocylindrales bacterium]|nr:gpW family head-tail joining protein [Candidatus Limnocylindrales bacterium]